MELAPFVIRHGTKTCCAPTARSAPLHEETMQSKIRFRRCPQFESLEPRIVFSADPIFSSLPFQQELESAESTAQFSLLDAHQTTGVEHVYENYGFNGSGQTVVVIDSGIAWDHYALGSGFGDEHRVVGGWDFAEGDANPYDDGSAGYHGTHVAGIIGSDAPEHRGVAPHVDLIGLRVFTDNGVGNLDWVEQALQWVHDHKNDFENPITTVNLSLGVDWNENSIPEWATLEDEFAQLQADNIFVSVAAGNGFENHANPGLAYPASSQYVVPVASHGSDGLLSDFSQRNERVLVAPGESIRSSVPDHLFGNSQNSNQTLSASGTSMAAPYVAGASVILREAMEFSGFENINQSLLYEHFRQTANPFFDATTGQIYHRIDLGAAVDAVIKDLHGAVAATATELGNLDTNQTVSGTIGRRTDVDAFVFSPQASGNLTLQINTTHELIPEVRIDGKLLEATNGLFEAHVTAGQQYVVSLTTKQGIGHYDMDLAVTNHQVATDLGVIDPQHRVAQELNGEAWYRLEASQTGIMTATASGGTIDLEIYDQSMQLLAAANSQDQTTRLDTMVALGQTYFIRAAGNASHLDLVLTNSIAVSGKHFTVNGTPSADSLEVTHLKNHQVQISINQIDYQFDPHLIDQLSILGFSGNDQLHFDLQSLGNEIFVRAGEAYITNSALHINANGFPGISVAGDTSDRIVFLDTAGDDQYWGMASQNTMSGAHYHNHSTGISDAMAVSRRGNDSASIMGTQEFDHFVATENHLQQTWLSGKRVAIGFSKLDVYGGGHQDTLVLHGGNGVDEFRGHETDISGVWQESQITATGINFTIFVANDLEDRITLQGGNSDEKAFSNGATTIMESHHYKNVALNFGDIVVTAGLGNDTARIQDTAGNDHLRANGQRVAMVGSNTNREFTGFDSAAIVALNGGMDVAVFEGTDERDVFFTQGNSAFAWNSTYHVGIIGFAQLHVDGRGGQDVAVLQGDSGNNEFHISRHQTSMKGQGYCLDLSGFESQRLNGKGGQNSVFMSGFQEGDRISAAGNELAVLLNDREIQAESFLWMEAHTEHSSSASKEIEAVDFWYALHGLWEDRDEH